MISHSIIPFPNSVVRVVSSSLKMIKKRIQAKFLYPFILLAQSMGLCSCFHTVSHGRICRPSPPRSGVSDRLIAKCITGAFCGHSPPFRVLVPCRYTKKIMDEVLSLVHNFLAESMGLEPTGLLHLTRFPGELLSHSVNSPEPVRLF